MKKAHTRPLAALLAVGVGLALFAPAGFADPEGAENAFAELALMSPADLDALRGRDGDTRITIENHQDLNAMVTGGDIHAQTVISGDISLGEHALDNFAGVGIFNFITGINNAANASVAVIFNLR